MYLVLVGFLDLKSRADFSCFNFIDLETEAA